MGGLDPPTQSARSRAANVIQFLGGRVEPGHREFEDL